MVQYHDREWSLPVHDDRKHFEFHRLHPTVSYGRDIEKLRRVDCQFGWLQGIRNLLRQNSFWLPRPDLNRRNISPR